MYKPAIYALQQRLYILNLRCKVLSEKAKTDKDLQPFHTHDVQEKESIEAALDLLQQKQILNA